MVEQTRSLGWWPSLYEPFHTLGAKIADWFSPPSEAAEGGDLVRGAVLAVLDALNRVLERHLDRP